MDGRESRRQAAREERRRAIDAWMAQMDAEPDHEAAFALGTDTVEDLRAGEREFAVRRAQRAAAIAAGRDLSYKQLGDHLGLSKARAEQMMNTAKRAGTDQGGPNNA